MKTNLKELDLPALEQFVTGLGEKKYRAKQVFQWMYRGAVSFDQMTDLPLPLRERLRETATLGVCTVARRQQSKRDGTRKYLFAFADGVAVESVLMRYKFGNALCVSSQAGCRRGCFFCVSGMDGFVRNLTAGEMAEQILAAERETGERIGQVTVMGTGEPFDNYEALARFIRLINSPEGLGIGMRHITVSTCGVAPMIGRFAEDFPQANLAVSLHASNDAARNAWMPVGRTYPLDVLLSACKAYTEKTSRRITFEYALIRGKNDDAQAADALAGLLGGMLCHVNLIPLNPAAAPGLSPTSGGGAAAFQAHLERRGIGVTIRRTLGTDIDAACGQLRRAVAPQRFN